MKQILKFIVLSLALCMIFTFFAACTKEKSSSPIETKAEVDAFENDEKKENKNGVVPFEIEQIEWRAEEGIVEGKRKITFNYTNNSKVSILELKITFREKSDMAPEEKESIYQYLITEFSLDEEESEKMKNLDFAISAEGEQLVKPGEKSSNLELNYFDGYYDVKKIAHFDQVVPDIATIRYVFENKIHTAYYDFVGKSYTKEEITEDAFYWTNTPLGDMIPKPNSEVVEKYLLDSNEYFGFTAWGMNFDDFEAYKELCIKKGYSVDVAQWEGYYIAKNIEGYHISLNFDEEKYSFDASISIPEEESL